MFSSVLFKRIFLSTTIGLAAAYLLIFWICAPVFEGAISRIQCEYIEENIEHSFDLLSVLPPDSSAVASNTSPEKKQAQLLAALHQQFSRSDHKPPGSLYIFDRHFTLLAPENLPDPTVHFLTSIDRITHTTVREAMKNAVNMPVVRVSYDDLLPGNKEETYRGWIKFLNDPGWYVLISLKESVLEKKQDRAAILLFFLMAGCFLVSLLVFGQSFRYFFKPIKILTEMGKEYLEKNGVSNLRFIADKSEAGVLGAAFYDVMEKQDELKNTERNWHIKYKQLFRSREQARERAWNMSRKNKHLEEKLFHYREINEQLSKSEDRYRAMLENIEEYFYEADLLGNLIFFNDALYRGLGYEKNELIGMNFRDFMEDDTADKAFWAFKRAYETGNPQKGTEWCLLRKDGSRFYIEISVSLIENQHREVIGFRGVARDVSNLIYLVNHDTLTGLNNRKAFFDRLEDILKIARRDNRSKNIFYLDLNKFKKVNDDFGHDVGDEVLIEVARRLRATLRETDHICRLGGDEFTVILNNLNGEYQPEEVAKRVYQALSEPYIIGSNIIDFISPSIGISTYPKDADALEDLIRRADIAMFVVKAHGGGYLFYNPTLEEEFEALKKKGRESR